MTIPTGQTYTNGDQGQLTMGIGELHTLAKHTLMTQVDDLVSALDTIAKTLENLEISWAGDEKNEAVKLLDRFSDVSASVFGTKKDPEKGVLARIAGGLQNAAYSYNQTETVVKDSWDKLLGDLKTILQGDTPSTDGSGSGDQTPPISEV
jgi:hypothetical protein